MNAVRHIPLIPLLLLAWPSLAQRKLTEATITYDIVINTSQDQARAADLMDGASSVIYLKGNSSRAEMISSLGTQATLMDGKTGEVTVLKDYGDQRYMIRMNATEWKHSNRKYEGVVFRYDTVYKTIAGYNCQRAEGRLADGTVFHVYFSRDLVPVNKDFQYLNRNLPGLAMQYEAAVGSTLVTYTVSSIQYSPIPQTKFDIPKSGYRVLTYTESLGGVN